MRDSTTLLSGTELASEASDDVLIAHSVYRCLHRGYGVLSGVKSLAKDGESSGSRGQCGYSRKDRPAARLEGY